MIIIKILLKAIPLLFLLLFHLAVNATTFEERELARSMLKTINDNNQICEYNKTCSAQRLSNIDKKIDVLKGIYKNYQSAMDILNKIDKYLNSTEFSPENLQDVINRISDWKQTNSNYENDPVIAELLHLLSSLQLCYENSKEKDLNIISWIKRVLEVKDFSALSELTMESLSEQANEKRQIETNDENIRKNNEKLKELEAIANLPKIRLISSTGGRNGSNTCSYYGGSDYHCVYTELGHDCSAGLREGGAVWCMVGQPGLGESIGGASIHRTYEGRNGNNFCTYWGGSDYRCIYTSKGYDCSSSLSDTDYVWCLKIR